MTKQAATVASAFQYSADSSDVSDLVSTFVAQQVTVPTSEAELEAVVSGGAQVVNDVGDVNEAKTSIETFANENTELLDGNVSDLIEPVPGGTWGTSKWDVFNWG